MPKVVGRSIVSTSDNIAGYNDDTLSVMYCLCGEYALIMDKPLNELPQRQTDKAFVLTKAKHTWKLNTTSDDKPIYLKRRGGLELQYRKRCKRCGLLVAYESAEHSPFLYVLDGALVSAQDAVAPAMPSSSYESALASSSASSSAEGSSAASVRTSAAIGGSELRRADEKR